MIRSMTGFGKASSQWQERSLDLELKSVNSRYLEVNIRMPRSLFPLEERMKKQIGDRCPRGKVDVFLTYRNLGQKEVEVLPDYSLAKAYLEGVRSLGQELGLKDDLTLSQLLRLDGVLDFHELPEDADSLWQWISQVLGQALDQLDSMRQTEGANLKKDLLTKRQEMLDKLDRVRDLSGDLPGKYYEKLKERLADFDHQAITEDRMAQELALFADRVAIDEEITRLASHLDQLKDLLETQKPVGRKLEFLTQELNREVNTMASKSPDLELTEITLDLKSDVEKIREQIQNIQ